MARSSVVQDIQAERNALRDTLKSGTEGGANQRYAQGTNIPGVLAADPATRKLMQESIYTRAYGTGRPTFTTAEQRYGGSSPTPAPTRVQPVTRYGQTPPPTPTQPTTGTVPPQSSTYSSMMDQINSRYGQTPAFDEAKTRAQSMADLQTQIDAIKQKYVGTIQAEQQRGEGRLGQQRGLSTVSGTRFSPRGAAEQTNVEGQNKSAIDAINADMNAEIAAATAAANGMLQQEIRYRGEQASSQADSYLKNMMSAYGLYQGDRQAEQDQAARYAQLTGSYGGAPTLALRQYLTDTQNQSFQNDLANRELQAKIDQAQQKNYSLSQLDDGTVVAFDPQTGQMSTLGKYAKQPASSSASGGRYGVGDPTSSAAMSAYYQAYGQLPSESLIPYYSDLYANEAQPQFGNPADGSYGPAFLGYSNPFATGVATYDSRYGRTDGAVANPYASPATASAPQTSGYYDDAGVWHNY